MSTLLVRAYRIVRAVIDLSIRILAALLSPSRCAACDVLLPGARVFCADCASAVERCARPGVLTPLRYGGAVKTAIRRFKYENRPDLANPLGHLLVGALRSCRAPRRTIVPVPLHPTRLADRGFNQATLLARVIAKHTDWPLLPRALARTRSTSAQARLGAADRKTNVAGAFRARAHLEGIDILLVDDVTTTGSTLAACAAALRAAGARSVTQITIAIQDLDG